MSEPNPINGETSWAVVVIDADGHNPENDYSRVSLIFDPSEGVTADEVSLWPTRVSAEREQFRLLEEDYSSPCYFVFVMEVKPLSLSRHGLVTTQFTAPVQPKMANATGKRKLDVGAD